MPFLEGAYGYGVYLNAVVAIAVTDGTIQGVSRKKPKKTQPDKEPIQKLLEPQVGILARVPRLWLCLGIFAFAFLIRLIYLLELSFSPVFEMLFVDSERYFNWAKSLAESNFGDDKVFYQEPLYPYFLAVYFKIFGVGYFGPRLIQIILGSLNAVFLFLVAERLFDRRVGLAAGIIASLYRVFVFYDAMILKTFLSILLFTALIFALTTADSRPARKRLWLAAGILMGLLALVRGNYLVVIAAFFVWTAIRLRKAEGGRGMRPALTAIGLCVCGMMIVLLPVAVRNARLGGGFVLTTSQGGQNFYIGNNIENVTGAYQPPWWVRANPMFEEADFRRAAREDLGDKPTPAELSWHYWKKGFRFIADNPGHAAKLQMKKVALFWEDYEVPDNQSIYFMKRYSWMFTLLYTPFGILAAFGAAGMILAWPRRREVSLLYIALGAYFISIIPFFIVARYRLPAVPILIVFAALAIVRIIDLVSRRAGAPWSGLDRTAFILAALMCVFSFYPFYSSLRRRQNEFMRYINLGRSYVEKKMYPLARVEFEEADRVYPEGPEAPFELGCLELRYAESGRSGAVSKALEKFDIALERARKLYRLGQASSPEYVPARYNKGLAFHCAGFLLEAEAEYKAASESDNPMYREKGLRSLRAVQNELSNESLF
ncbi:MAG: glycosyltransferase family 39 protein, partial [Planctomycetota bacterium]